MRGGVRRYAARETPKIDAARGEKDPFRMETSYISSRRIGVDPEAVDMHIMENAKAGDVVVTQDVPLASALVPKGVIVIGTRGELFTEENIGERLSTRNLMQNLREAGGITPGPKEFGRKDRQRFADTLDRVLTVLHKGTF